MKRTSVVTSRKPRIISSIIFVLLFGSSAQAQNGDWQAVENLKPGTRLTVKARHNILCIFQSATDDELVCKPLRFRHLGPGESRFDRQSVREIRLEPNLAKHMWVGAGIGAGAGAIAGATTGSPPRGGRIIVSTLAGAAAGSILGGTLSIPLRGKLIYRR